MNDDQFKAYLSRLGKPPDRAVESYKYQDPARAVKFSGERKGGRMDQEVKDLLDRWADWMRKPEALAEGYPEEASGGFIPSWCKDTEEAAVCADNETITRIDAAFDSLKRRYQDAILKHYDLGDLSGPQVWRFNQAATFEEALIVIRVKFVAKGLL